MKKILIVSTYAPPGISGTTHMMYYLFRHFPCDSFVFLTSHAGINKNAVEKGYALKAKYFYFDTLVLTNSLRKDGSFFQKAKRLIKKNFILLYLADLLSFFYFAINITRYGKKIIKDENIDVLLAYSSNGLPFFSAYLLHLITKKPLYLFFYDLYLGNKMPPLYNMIAFLLEPKIFRKAEKIFVMSEKLQEYYQKKYKRDTIVIHNSIPIERKLFESAEHRGQPYKIIYTGAIYWAQAGAIKNVIKAVNDLRELDIKFLIYTTTGKKELNEQGIFESEKVFFTSAAPTEMPNIQKSADILLVSLSFDSKFSLLINTSSPGKTYEYLVSGRPILVFAPKDSYVSEYARKHDFALVVDAPDNERLKRAIIKLATDKKMAEKLVGNAFKTAELNHNACKSSKLFQSYLGV